MEFVNFFTKQKQRPRQIMKQFILLLAPLAPHLAEELREMLGHDKTLAYETWPEYDDKLAVDQTVEIPVQINGKVRSRISIERGLDKDAILAAAKSDDKIAEHLDGKTIRKEIVVPDKLVNFVVA